MSATDRIMGSLQQSSSAMGSSAILSFKPLHPCYGSHKKLILSLQASMARKDDCGATLHKTDEESSSRSSSVSSLLKAVQKGGSSVVLQQVSSIRHFFTPDLPHAIITEIKKRMALSFKDQDDEENAIQDDLNGGLLQEDVEEQVTILGPRCAWPRLKLASAEGEQQEEGIGGPRCAWPRAAAQMQSSSNSVQQWKQEERAWTTIGEGARGAKCAWPRVTSRNYYQNNKERCEKEGMSKSPQEGLLTSMNAIEGLQNGALSKSSQEGLEKEEALVNSSVVEGPRCAWPRATTPRRMLATGVGLSLFNYLFIGQGVSALAILLETPFPIICEEAPSPSNPHKSLLP